MKNKILKTISWIMGIMFLLGACSMDTEGTWIPTIMVVVSEVWFLLFGYANDWFEGMVDDY